ncbi:MAG TPA: hypothetical protein VMH88_02800 [Gemmatimonadales bacterium]|nr:hypothetical protein [Gemmatimonadales bacterium]
MPSRKVLRRAARYLDREMAMLLETADRLRRLGAGGGEPVVKRALLESWASQLNRFFEFFHPTKDTDPASVVAAHFFRGTSAWHRRVRALTARQRRRRRALDAMLGHWRYGHHTRVRAWSETDHQLIAKRVRLFINALPARRRRWFPEAAKKLMNQMDLLDLL